MDLIGTAVVKGSLADGTEIRAVTVEAGTAMAAWESLREAHAASGLWPFLVDAVEPTVLDKLPRTAEHGTHREHHRSAAEIFVTGKVPANGGEEAGGAAKQQAGAESQAVAAPTTAHTTTIGLIAAEYGGVEIPGLLDWDAAPGTSGIEHTAVLADWRRRYGAELMTLTSDRIELIVPRPPTEPDEVAAVALEHAAYCSGAAFQSGRQLWCFSW